MIKVDNIRFIDVLWFNELGVVKCIDEITGEIKFYIGRGPGVSEIYDIKSIIKCGTKQTQEQMKDLLENFIKWNGKNEDR